MSTLYKENPKQFAIGYLIHKTLGASFTSLEAIVPASRKVISKVFAEPEFVKEMEAALKSEKLTLPKSYLRNLNKPDVTYDELITLLFPGEAKASATEPVAQNGPKNPTTASNKPVDDEISFVATKDSIVLTKGDETRTVKKDSNAYLEVKGHILNDELETAWSMASPKEALLKVTKGNVTIEGDEIKFRGLPMRNEMGNRILALMQRSGRGYAEHLANFADKCMENPSFRATTELLGFMEKNTLPICPDGDFLTYKKVRGDFLDIHSGTVLNKPAALMSDVEKAKCPIFVQNGKVTTEIVDGKTIVHMPRNEVDDNYQNTCSNGLHVCGYSYLSHFGGGGSDVILICKVNPRDVVSVPKDYNDQKMRTCRYEVVKTIANGEQVKNMFVDDMNKI